MSGLVFDTLIDELASRVAAKIAPAPAKELDLVDQAALPPALRKAYMLAAKRGELPTMKKGRAVVARRADFNAWLEQSKRVPRRRKVEVSDDEAEIERALGVRRVRGA